MWFFCGILVPTVFFDFIYPKTNDPDFWTKKINAMETLHYINSIWIIGVVILVGIFFWHFLKMFDK